MQVLKDIWRFFSNRDYCFHFPEAASSDVLDKFCKSSLNPFVRINVSYTGFPRIPHFQLRTNTAIIEFLALSVHLFAIIFMKSIAQSTSFNQKI